MRRRGISPVPGAAIVLGLLAASMLVPVGAAASGGGGCGGPVTDEAGSSVDIIGACFTPTILRVDLGRSVTFAKQDPFRHTVLGANGSWGGYDALKGRSDVTYAFTELGIYPYVCTLHVGMVGAIVVGDGSGGAIDTTTAAGPVVRTAAAARVTWASVGLADASWPAVVIGGFGLIAAGGAIAVLRRRRRPLA